MGSDLTCRGALGGSRIFLLSSIKVGRLRRDAPTNQDPETQKKAAQTARPALPATAPTVRFSRISMLNT